MENLKQEQASPDFFADQTKSKIVGKEIKLLEDKLDTVNKIQKEFNDCDAMIEILAIEFDSDIDNELGLKIKQLDSELEEFKIATLLNGKYDDYDAIITLHSGAGGTEAQDWVQMLYRMYQMYSEKKGYKVKVLDVLQGDEAGIKSITIGISGENAYGYLKCEKGVHRLVRISPFDANARRHTSFASVEVMPEIEEMPEIEIKSEDLRIDTYRSSGAGGQHVNKTDSAIRITHIPTGIVVACQNERSQVQNKEMAMKMLYSKLAILKEEEEQAKLNSIKGDVKKIEWGSQIRSYVFCPYTLVKDHRTNMEMTDIEAVMNGDIQPFINEYLVKSN